VTTDLLGAARERLADRADRATDPRVTVGERVVLADLSDPDHGRLAGLAHRPRGGEGSVGTDGDSVADLARQATDGDDLLERAAGVATLNALSAPEVDWRRGDPMAALSTDVEVVATVGLFRPAFRKFDDVTVRVVERDPPESVDAPPSVTVETYRPHECERAFADADVCFVTGSTLIYGGIDRYLSALAAADVSPVVLVGATASQVPEPAFAAGVDVVAGALVTDVDVVRDRVAAGDCGTDLHEAGVAKVYVAHPASDGLPVLELTEPGEHTNVSNTHTKQ
jgi:uncharacterized protein (DUF4213/DUF364 family)